MNFAEIVSQVVLSKSDGMVVAISYPTALQFIGNGRSAVVFRLKKDPSKALKVFHPQFAEMAENEIAVYLKLGHSPYYPQMYAYGKLYLVIEYIEGKTLFKCLTEGIFIPEKVIHEVDAAIEHARKKGLNPSDIHLRNIMLTEQGVKMIDVARFLQKKDCRQWDDLKKAYYQMYLHPSFPKKIPERILNYIASKYHKKQIRI
ncbi:serine/threonine protein kinase [Bacillaceae bacterium]